MSELGAEIINDLTDLRDGLRTSGAAERRYDSFTTCGGEWIFDEDESIDRWVRMLTSEPWDTVTFEVR